MILAHQPSFPNFECNHKLDVCICKMAFDIMKKLKKQIITQLCEKSTFEKVI
jgi:hypothetical protein